MFHGPSGAGKSKVIQGVAGCLATGIEFIDIYPNAAYKVLYIQAEDTVDDLAESFQGYAKHNLGSDATAIKALEDNLTVVTVVGKDGYEFIQLVDRLCDKHKPDVLIIDPLLAFIGCDVVDQKAVTKFLRGYLRPLLMKHNCGFIGVHHSRKDKGGPSIDQAIGAMEFSAFFRGMIALVVREEHHREVTLKVVKRQRQLEWTDEEGAPTDTKFILKANDGVYFTEVTGFSLGETKTGGRPTKANRSDVINFIKSERAKGINDAAVVARVREVFKYSAKQAKRYVDDVPAVPVVSKPETSTKNEEELPF